MLHEKNHAALVESNQTLGYHYREFLIRVTPNNARVDSSNLNPQEFWNFGLSMVALNYQTPGLSFSIFIF
jgi:hypothetical protein